MIGVLVLLGAPVVATALAIWLAVRSISRPENAKESLWKIRQAGAERALSVRMKGIFQ